MKKTPIPHWPEAERFDKRYISQKLYDENSKVLGSFEEELPLNDRAIIISKKVWYIENNGKPVKFRFKGINKQAIMITPEQYYKMKIITSSKYIQNLKKQPKNKIRTIINDFFNDDVYQDDKEIETNINLA